MAWFITSSQLKESSGEGEWWKKVHAPAETVPLSGIYKCTGCKKEVTSNAGDKFPPQNHHQHSQTQGQIRWQLNVRTNTKGE
jgi:hypothetical protein